MAYIGNKPTIGNFQICDAISVVNGQAAYTMQVGSVNVIPQSANHMIVSLNGTIQKPGSSFTVSGSTITFASNLATGDVIDFTKDVMLQDDSDGNGAYIKEWNLDIAQPTNAQLSAQESAADTEEANNVVRSTRRTAYGDIGEQLDEIYKDIDAWKARIKSIKDANPKS